MMRFVKLLIITVVFGILSLPAIADGVKIGVVNATRIMNEIPQADAIRKNIKDEFAPRDKKILAMQTELKKHEEQLSKKSEFMSDTVRSETEKKIFTLKRDVKRAREEFTEDLNIRRNDELGTLQKLVYEAIVSFAKQNDFDIILGETVLYSSVQVDVTDKIISQLKLEFREKNSK